VERYLINSKLLILKFKVAENESRLMTDPAPQVMIASMADSAVNIQLRAWATNENYWSAY
jgi:small conductance mechanosensitive channel